MLRTLLLILGAALGTEGASGPAITVSVAVSLTEAMQEIAKAYEAAAGHRIVLNSAGSNVLARQIVNGAPVDVFISADAAQMDVVERAKLVSPGTRMPLVGNQLVIVVPSGRSEPLVSAAGLAAPGVRRIAIGDTAAVPAGVYAKQYLERAGLWQSLLPKLLPSTNVRAALAAVESGAADAGIVYAIDARAARTVRVAVVIAGSDAPVIVYPACAIRSSKQPDRAAAFLTFLYTPQARLIFQRWGFQPIAAGH